MIKTKYRTIKTLIPVPQSRYLLNKLAKYEPRSVNCQPPLIWESAKDFQVYDPYGNIWLDWSSGVLVANAGHAPEEIKQAINKTVKKGLLFNYCFPSKPRIELAEELVKITPPSLNKAYILTTGSETIEAAIKLARTYSMRKWSKRKIGIISFKNAFHGRTMGAQMVGGFDAQKEWIVNLDKDMHQVPYPDGFRFKDTTFNTFLKNVNNISNNPKNYIAAVLIEPYLGGGASFAPKKYVQELRQWCNDNNVLLIFDEIQSSFGRTGKLFAFEHFNIVPDIICCGKGISGALPLSAVIGGSEIMDLYGPGEMTSTHGGNPVCCASALANLRLIKRKKLVDRAQINGEFLFKGLQKLAKKYSSIIGALHGKGLVYGLHIVKSKSSEPDGELAQKIVYRCFENGLLMFSPVGSGNATIKICPPLTIIQEAITEGLDVLDQAFGTVVKNQ